MSRYPKLGLRSKNELAKRISSKRLNQKAALALINDVMANFDGYWRDTKRSEPEKGKFVRSAKGMPLGRLLKLIDKKILAPQDKLVPEFIFGGVAGKSHIQAARRLLGTKGDRTLIGLDISRFFEQVQERRVFYFFYSKCGCGKDAARILARLCCVPKGSKGTLNTDKTLARGFATSTRLALWCNLDLFIRIDCMAKKHLHGHNPRIAVFVDDIGITASKIDYKQAEKISDIAEGMLANFDSNQPLPVNQNKKKIRTFAQGAEHLGLKFGKHKLSMGDKTLSKRDNVRNRLKTALPKTERTKLLKKKKAYYVYGKQIAGV